MGEELWEILGHNNTIAYESWPEYDEEKTKESVVTYAVSVNGKLRDKIEVEANTNSKEVEAIALSSSKIKAYTDGHQIVKVIVVPNKIVNIVIK
jgi:leucyl-tRNA synthetase